MNDRNTFTVPSKVVWTVILFLAVQTAGGLYYAGRILAQFETAVAAIKEVQEEQKANGERITRNREALIRLGAFPRARPPWE